MCVRFVLRGGEVVFEKGCEKELKKCTIKLDWYLYRPYGGGGVVHGIYIYEGGETRRRNRASTHHFFRSPTSSLPPSRSFAHGRRCPSAFIS